MEERLPRYAGGVVMASPIFLVTGPPGSGKTTLSTRIARAYPFAIHLEVDKLREWVVSGLSSPLAWTDETERQFQIAERAASAVARAYSDSGGVVVIDHCRNLPRLNQLVEDELAEYAVTRVLVITELSETLRRNAGRENKAFDPVMLEAVMKHTHAAYLRDLDRHGQGWIMVEGGEVDLNELTKMKP